MPLNNPRPGGYRQNSNVFGNQLLGQSHETWLSRMGVSEEQLQSMINELLRNIGTTQRAGYNRVGEISAMNDLPLATQMAMERGVDIETQKAGTGGVASLQQYANTANRQAWQNIMSGEFQERKLNIMQDQMDQDFWQSFMGLIGSGAQAAGYYYGGGGTTIL